MVYSKQKRKKRRAVLKGMMTRAVNKAWRDQWEKYDRPALESYARLWNYFLGLPSPTRVVLSEHGKEQLRFKGGAIQGDLLTVQNWGRTVVVLIDGYKRPKEFAFHFWTPLLPSEANDN